MVASKEALIHGATDEVGYQAVEDRHYYSDLHATLLHQLGIDHNKMFLPELGPVSLLVEEGNGPIHAIMAWKVTLPASVVEKKKTTKVISPMVTGGHIAARAFTAYVIHSQAFLE